MIELKHKRSEYATHFDNGDGTFANRVFAGPAYYYNWDGRGDGEVRWREINCQWTDTGTTFMSEFGPYRVTAPYLASGSLQFVNLRSDGSKHNNRPFTSSMPAALPIQGVIEGDSIVYTDALGAGSDLIYKLRATGVTRYIRVRAGATPAPQYVIQFTAGASTKIERRGAQAYKLDDRGPKVTDTNAVTALVNGQDETYIRPFASLVGLRSNTLSVTLEKTADNQFTITKSVPVDWDGATDILLDDSQTVTTGTNDGATVGTNASWATARSTATSVASGTTSHAVGGYEYNAGVYYSVERYFAYFTNTIPVGATINSATISTNCFLLGSGGSGGDYVWYEGTQNSTLGLGDHNAFNSTEVTDRVAGAIDTTWDFTLNASGLATITPGATDKFALRNYTYDAANSTPPLNTNLYVGIYSADDGTASNRPDITISYTPQVPNKRRMMRGLGK